MHVHELNDYFFSFHHHVVEHVDDIILVIDIVLGDLVDGVLELVVVLDDLRDMFVDVVRVFELLVVLDLLVDDDMPLSSLSNPLSCLILSNPLSYLFLSNIVPCRTCSVVKATTGTGAEPVEPFSFMGADAARLMGAKAARSLELSASSLYMCPIAPVELDAANPGRVSASSPPPRRVTSAARRASIASWACIFSASN